MREELDFKSLRFFSALFRLGNVSPAAEALNVSQPTGSLRDIPQAEEGGKKT